jgi:hypothetical protein
MVESILFFIVFLIGFNLYWGFRKCDELYIVFEWNLLTSPFYNIGPSFNLYKNPDGSIEEELKIGLFFLTVMFIFWKENE